MKKHWLSIFMCSLILVLAILPSFSLWNEANIESYEEVDDGEDDDDPEEETDPTAKTVTSDAGFTYTLSSTGQTATLSSYSGEAEEITIATTILVADEVIEDPEDSSTGTTYDVTAIGNYAFQNNTTIKAVTGGV